jgi:protein-S-isoprenylcysteine O-methyltransferase Ste14
MKHSALLIFLILSIPVIYISRKSLFKIWNHGFYRFLSWECILWLFANNYNVWFRDPLGPVQVISWILLFYSVYPVISGVMQLRRAKKSVSERKEKELFKFEQTTELVTRGIYKYIRHPLYSSLLFLTWGIYLKNPDLLLFAVASASTVFLYFTARMDEKECISYFGEEYKVYMKTTKMFVPYIF